MLPVRSLLRFRGACKTWYSTISDPEFCNKLHQNRACVLVSRKKPNTFSTVTIENNTIRSTPLSLPWEQEPRSEHGSRSEFLGSCNGLVCVDYSSADMSGLILWNPSTRKFKELPANSPGDDWSYHNTYAGFGYDESTGDYKFVWMVCKPFRSPGKKIIFEVFSLKSNTWSRYEYSSDIILQDMRTFSPKLTGVLSNGAIHWVIHCNDDHSSDSFRIIAFDLASHNYRLLGTPEERGKSVGSSYVVSLSGCLCLCRPYALDGFLIDLWVMKEYGVSSSWSKLVTIPSSSHVRAIYPILFSDEEGTLVAMVLHFLNKGKKVCEIVRFQVEKGEVVEDETLLCDEVGTMLFEDYTVLHMEETFASID